MTPQEQFDAFLNGLHGEPEDWTDHHTLRALARAHNPALVSRLSAWGREVYETFFAPVTGVPA